MFSVDREKLFEIVVESTYYNGFIVASTTSKSGDEWTSNRLLALANPETEQQSFGRN